MFIFLLRKPVHYLFHSFPPIKGSNLIKTWMQRLSFPFPFVHHQSYDWKVEQLLTLEPDVFSSLLSSIGSGITFLSFAMFSHHLFLSTLFLWLSSFKCTKRKKLINHQSLGRYFIISFLSNNNLFYEKEYQIERTKGRKRRL